MKNINKIDFLVFKSANHFRVWLAYTFEDKAEFLDFCLNEKINGIIVDQKKVKDIKSFVGDIPAGF